MFKVCIKTGQEICGGVPGKAFFGLTAIGFIKLSSMARGSVSDLLPEQLFFRIHNSYSVNMTYIQRLEYTGRNGFVHLQQGIALPVSVKRMGVV